MPLTNDCSSMKPLMARRTVHDPREITRVAQRLAGQGPVEAVTIAAIVRASGAPAGSIYHRFDSREDLLAAAWLDAVTAFQAVFLGALPAGPAATVAAVLKWAREAPDMARLVVLRLPRDLHSTAWPPGRVAQAARLAAELEAGLDGFCETHLGQRGGEARRRVTFALLDLPHAALRRYLAAGIPPPPEVDAYVASAVRALLTADPPPT